MHAYVYVLVHHHHFYIGPCFSFSGSTLFIGSKKIHPTRTRRLKKKKKKKWVKFFFFISIILLHVSLFYILSSYQLVGYMCVCVHKLLFAWKKKIQFSFHLIIWSSSSFHLLYMFTIHSFIHTWWQELFGFFFLC